MLSYLGPQVYMLLMDARAERKKEQVCSKFTYDRIFTEIQKLPPTVEHLVFLLGKAAPNLRMSNQLTGEILQVSPSPIHVSELPRPLSLII